MPDWGRCSFCGRSEERVKRLIAGPSVYICDECVALCQGDPDQRGESQHGDEQCGVYGTVLRSVRGLACRRRGSSGQPRKLSYLQRRVIELLYGLNDEPPRTCSEVARTFRLALDKLAQIENESLAALRGPSQP